MKPIPQLAYEAYQQNRAVKGWMPFKLLSKECKQAWEAAVKAVQQATNNKKEESK